MACWWLDLISSRFENVPLMSMVPAAALHLMPDVLCRMSLSLRCLTTGKGSLEQLSCQEASLAHGKASKAADSLHTAKWPIRDVHNTVLFTPVHVRRHMLYIREQFGHYTATGGCAVMHDRSTVMASIYCCVQAVHVRHRQQDSQQSPSCLCNTKDNICMYMCSFVMMPCAHWQASCWSAGWKYCHSCMQGWSNLCNVRLHCCGMVLIICLQLWPAGYLHGQQTLKGS